MVIYLTTNLINNKKYIGKDTNNNDSYLGSGVDLKKDIKMFGKSNFKKEILEYCNNKQHLVEREEYYLQKYDVENNPEFYNKTNKSFGNSGQTEEGKKKISEARKGWIPSDEIKTKISKNRKGIKHQDHPKGKNHKGYGKPKSESHKKRMSEVRKGQSPTHTTPHTEKTKQVIKMKKMGSKASEETKLKKSIAMKAYWERRKNGLL
jgi:hypothetical protein